MDDRFDLLLDLLKASLKKNGDTVITISHLINMMAMVNQKSAELEERRNKDGLDAIEDNWGNS